MVSQTAIEYGVSRLRLLAFDGSGKKLRVTGVHEASLEVAAAPGDETVAEDARAELVAEAVAEAGFRSDPSAMAFDASLAVFREFDLPFTNDEQIRKVVRFEAESHIPMDLDDVVMQHVVLRKTRDKSHVLVAAVKKDDLLDQLDILSESGVDPMHVEIDVLALFTALVGSGVADKHESFVVVNAQERTTSLLFVQEGGLYAVRSIRIGTRSVGHGLDEDAPAASEQEAELERARTHDYLARLTREVRRTLTTLPGRQAPEVVWATGTGARLTGFHEALHEAFGAPVETLDWLEHVDHTLDEDEAERLGPDLGVALGMAYKLNGLDIFDTEFRREEAAYTGKFDQVVAPLIVVSMLVLLGAAFLFIDALLGVKRLNNEYDKMFDVAARQLHSMRSDEDQADVMADIRRAEFGPRQIERSLTLAKQEWDEVAQKLGRGTEIPELSSALLVWVELFDTLKAHEKAIGRLALERMDINMDLKQPLLTLTGEVETSTRYQVLEDLLAERPMFTEITSASLKQMPAGTVRFTDMKITLDAQLAKRALE